MKNKEQLDYIDTELKAVNEKRKELRKGLKSKDIRTTANTVKLLREYVSWENELKEQRKRIKGLDKHGKKE